MWRGLQDAGTRRLWVAAGLSVALHTAIAVAVQRPPGSSASPLTSEYTALPLFARLATAVTDSMLSTAQVISPVAETAMQRTPSPPATIAAVPANAAPAEPGAAYYFKSSELDRGPYPVLSLVVPPPESGAAQVGAVMLRLRISERGRVDDAKIIMSTGIAEFEAAALREFSRADFHPGYRGKLPVRSEMTIQVTLNPPKTTARSQLAGTDSTTQD